MTFIFLVIGIIILGFAVIAGLVLTVVGLSTDKAQLRNAGIITLGSSLILLVAGIFYTVNRTVEKVKDTFNNVSHNIDSTMQSGTNTYNDVFEDDRTNLLNNPVNPQIQKIKSFIPEEMEKNVNPSFYTYFGTQGAFRFPAVYPYSIHCQDTKDFGTLVDEGKVEDVKNGGGSEENIMFGVTHFNYDGKMLLLQTTNKLTPDSDTKEKIGYYIYDISARKLTGFNSEKELFGKAAKLGYSEEQKLFSITDYDYLF